MTHFIPLTLSNSYGRVWNSVVLNAHFADSQRLDHQEPVHSPKSSPYKGRRLYTTILPANDTRILNRPALKAEKFGISFNTEWGIGLDCDKLPAKGKGGT